MSATQQGLPGMNTPGLKLTPTPKCDCCRPRQQCGICGSWMNRGGLGGHRGTRPCRFRKACGMSVHLLAGKAEAPRPLVKSLRALGVLEDWTGFHWYTKNRGETWPQSVQDQGEEWRLVEGVLKTPPAKAIDEIIAKHGVNNVRPGTRWGRWTIAPLWALRFARHVEREIDRHSKALGIRDEYRRGIVEAVSPPGGDPDLLRALRREPGLDLDVDDVIALIGHSRWPAGEPRQRALTEKWSPEIEAREQTKKRFTGPTAATTATTEGEKSHGDEQTGRGTGRGSDREVEEEEAAPPPTDDVGRAQERDRQPHP